MYNYNKVKNVIFLGGKNEKIQMREKPERSIQSMRQLHDPQIFNA